MKYQSFFFLSRKVFLHILIFVKNPIILGRTISFGFRKLALYGIHPGQELIPILPAEHFFCGGVATDLRGRTSPNISRQLEEVVFGVHGANRLASNSLLWRIIFLGLFLKTFRSKRKKIFWIPRWFWTLWNAPFSQKLEMTQKYGNRFDISAGILKFGALLKIATSERRTCTSQNQKERETKYKLLLPHSWQAKKDFNERESRMSFRSFFRDKVVFSGLIFRSSRIWWSVVMRRRKSHRHSFQRSFPWIVFCAAKRGFVYHYPFSYFELRCFGEDYYERALRQRNGVGKFRHVVRNFGTKIKNTGSLSNRNHHARFGHVDPKVTPDKN